MPQRIVLPDKYTCSSALAKYCRHRIRLSLLKVCMVVFSPFQFLLFCPSHSPSCRVGDIEMLVLSEAEEALILRGK